MTEPLEPKDWRANETRRSELPRPPFRRFSTALRSLLACGLVLAIAACGDDSDDNSVTAPGENEPTLMANFSAPDVNETSPRFDESVSPRDYTGQVSAWYFGHST